MKTHQARRWNPVRALMLALTLALAAPVGAAAAALSSADGRGATLAVTTFPKADGGIDASPLDQIDPQPAGYAAREAAQPQAAAFRGKGVEIYIGGSALAVVVGVVLGVVLL
jgi:hypothetical protein